MIDYQRAWEDQATDLAPYTTTRPGARSISVKAKPTAEQVAALGPKLPDVFAPLAVAS